MITTRALIVAASLTLVVLAGGSLADQLASEHEDTWPTYEDVQTALDEAAQHDWVTVETVGASEEDREIRVAHVTNPDGTTPVEDRPVTLFLTQQHGNEPAGTPAALRLLENITQDAPIQDTLDDQVLLVLPMANPDGSEAFTRGNTDGVDTNRDHVALGTSEARAMHEVFNRWDVDVALDHHEYGGTGLGNPVPVRVYDYDLTTLYPRHGNVPQPALDAAQDLMYEALWPAAEEEGYTANEYGEVTAHGEPVDEIAGGPDPGIARNHYGLHNAASILVETRVDMHPNPFHDTERRIHVHTVVMRATLEHVSEHAAWFASASDASAELARTHPDRMYTEGDTSAPFAPAYRFHNDTSVRETFRGHGMNPGVDTGQGLVHETGHALHGHAGALLHPDSSRAITDAVATGPLEPGGDALDPLSAQEAPWGAGLAFFSVLAAAWVARARDLR